MEISDGLPVNYGAILDSIADGVVTVNLDRTLGLFINCTY
jgi:hypothetical protein